MTAATSRYDDLVLAHDPDGAASLQRDSVMGITRTSRTLVNATPVRPIRSALDLGCGSGLFALLAARRAERVVASDLNPRACEYVVENAARNGFTNIEARVGSLFEPVAGERFDLITSNLPFVVSPDSEYAFRDSGMSGDEISRLAVTEAPDYLSDGGIAVITASWAVRNDDTWAETVQAWIDPHECDVWVLGGATQSPEDYVHRWNGELLREDPTRYATTRQRWLAYYADERIRELCYGVIVLQRRDQAAPWKRIDNQEVVPTEGGGAQVDRALRNGHRFAGGDSSDLDSALLEQSVFSLVGPHHLNQRLDYAADRYQSRTATMVLGETCGIVGAIEPLTAQVLLRVDGERLLGSLIDEAAFETGIDRASIAEPAVRNFSDLVQTGLVQINDG